MSSQVYHPPVLLKESLDFLLAKRGGIFLDATLGGGGHARAILLSNPKNRLIAIDRDELAIEKAMKALEPFGDRVSIYHGNFSQLDEVLQSEGIEKVDGVLFDLGVSHFQLRENGRGFSFWKDEPLDMRMDKSQKLTAMDVVNTLSEQELAKIIFEYGQERAARKIARYIVKYRKKKPIRSTAELASIVERVIPKRRNARKHPALKTFQAIRIYVNRELDELKEALPKAVNHLTLGGRLVVISFHSLEDRIVKRFFRESNELETVTKKPISPSEEEVRQNPASRSAKLRAAEKIKRANPL